MLLPGDDPVAFLLAVGELVRMGEPGEAWMPEVASAAWVACDVTDDASVDAAIASSQAQQNDFWALRGLKDAAAIASDLSGLGQQAR